MFTKGMAIYIGQRLVMIVFTVLAVSSVVFLGIHRLPGDALLNEKVKGAAYLALLHHYGLDQPLWVQYKDYIIGIVTRGDLGESLVNRGLKIGPLVFREVEEEVRVLARAKQPGRPAPRVARRHRPLLGR